MITTFAAITANRAIEYKCSILDSLESHNSCCAGMVSGECKPKPLQRGQAARGEAALGTSSRKRNPERDLHGHDRAPVARHTRISSAAEAALPLWEQAEVP